MSQIYTVEGLVKKISASVPIGNYTKRTLVLDEMDEYPQTIAIDFWNAAIEQIDPLDKGAHVVVSFRVKSREHGDKWYTNANGVSVEDLSRAEPPEPPRRSAAPLTPPANKRPRFRPDDDLDDDVPF